MTSLQSARFWSRRNVCRLSRILLALLCFCSVYGRRVLVKHESEGDSSRLARSYERSRTKWTTTTDAIRRYRLSTSPRSQKNIPFYNSINRGFVKKKAKILVESPFKNIPRLVSVKNSHFNKYNKGENSSDADAADLSYLAFLSRFSPKEAIILRKLFRNLYKYRKLKLHFRSSKYVTYAQHPIHARTHVDMKTNRKQDFTKYFIGRDFKAHELNSGYNEGTLFTVDKSRDLLGLRRLRRDKREISTGNTTSLAPTTTKIYQDLKTEKGRSGEKTSTEINQPAYTNGANGRFTRAIFVTNNSDQSYSSGNSTTSTVKRDSDVSHVRNIAINHSSSAPTATVSAWREIIDNENGTHSTTVTTVRSAAAAFVTTETRSTAKQTTSGVKQVPSENGTTRINASIGLFSTLATNLTKGTSLRSVGVSSPPFTETTKPDAPLKTTFSPKTTIDAKSRRNSSKPEAETTVEFVSSKPHPETTAEYVSSKSKAETTAKYISSKSKAETTAEYISSKLKAETTSKYISSKLKAETTAEYISSKSKAETTAKYGSSKSKAETTSKYISSKLKAETTAKYGSSKLKAETTSKYISSKLKAETTAEYISSKSKAETTAKYGSSKSKAETTSKYISSKLKAETTAEYVSSKSKAETKAEFVSSKSKAETTAKYGSSKSKAETTSKYISSKLKAETTAEYVSSKSKAETTSKYISSKLKAETTAEYVSSKSKAATTAKYVSSKSKAATTAKYVSSKSKAETTSTLKAETTAEYVSSKPKAESTAEYISSKPKAESTAEYISSKPKAESTAEYVSSAPKPYAEKPLDSSNMTREPGTMPEPGGAEPEATAFAEPIPDWPVAKLQWKQAWEFHLYFIGTLFAILALYTFISIIRLWKMKQLFSKPYFVSLNSLICLFSIARVLYMFIDGYNSHSRLPTVVNYFLYSIGFPCIVSVYSLLFYALLQATQLRLLSPKIQKAKFLIATIAIHFFISILTDFVVGFFYGAKVMLILCEAVSITWGFFLIIAFFYIFRQMHASAKQRQKVVEQLSSIHRNNYSMYDKREKVPQYTLSLAVKLAFATSLFGVVYVGLHIYGLIGVYNIYAFSQPKPWPWWIYHFCLRLVEFTMCSTMAYVATQPFRYLRSEKRSSLFCYLPCRNIISPETYDSNVENIQWDKLDKNLVYKSSYTQTTKNENNGYKTKFLNKSFFLPEIRRLNNVVTKQASNVYSVNGQMNVSSEENVDYRPSSMLVIENGYIRFRSDAELVREAKLSASYESIANNLTDREGAAESELERRDNQPIYCNVETVAVVKDNAAAQAATKKHVNCDNRSDVEVFSAASLQGSVTSFAPIAANFSVSIENEIQRRMENNVEWKWSKSNLSDQSGSSYDNGENVENSPKSSTLKHRVITPMKSDATRSLEGDNDFDNTYKFVDKPVNKVLLAKKFSDSLMPEVERCDRRRYALVRSHSDTVYSKKRNTARAVNNIRYYSLTDLDNGVDSEDSPLDSDSDGSLSDRTDDAGRGSTSYHDRSRDWSYVDSTQTWADSYIADSPC